MTVIAFASVMALAMPAGAMAAENSRPFSPKVFTSYPSACGTAEQPTFRTRSISSSYTAIPLDDDGDDVVTRVEIARADGTIVYTMDSWPTASETAWIYSPIPEGVLVNGQTYFYRGKSQDDVGYGPYSSPCYFTYDTVAPGAPTIESADFPGDSESRPTLARTTGTVTLRKAPGDTDVAAFRYGLAPERVTRTIIPGPDGSAVLPLTIPDDRGSGLYVRAVDRAGNVSADVAWDLNAQDNPAPQSHVPGDLTGDGRADVTAVLEHGFDLAKVWNITARDGGFHTGTAIFDPGLTSGFDVSRIRHVRGDFDGDGRTDVALLRQDSRGVTRLGLLLSDSNGLGARAEEWTSGTEPWPIRDLRMFAGDFNADGKSDVAVQRATASGWQVSVFPGGAMGTPVTWLQGTENWQSAPLVAGDFDGDGRTDLAQMRDLGSCRANLLVHQSTGTSFGAGVLRWDSGQGGYCVNRGKLVAGDLDHDGVDEIVSMYDHGGSDTALLVFGLANGFTPSDWWRRSGELTAAGSALSTGDFDLDGKADLAVVTAAGDQTQLWTLRSTGTSFANRALGWQQAVGGRPVPDPR
jgi:hypothetical protein